jgi:hypothetical protein
MAFSYILVQVLNWIADFFRHWYVDGFGAFVKAFLRLLSTFDRALAFRVSVKNLFNPMYQDRSVLGYVFGFFFRLVRISVALVMYVVLGAVFIILYTAWALIPPYLIVRALNLNDYSVF